MKIKSESIELVDINTPVPYDKNMHIHTDEQIDRLIKLIDYQGFRNPLVLQKGTNRIAAGHGRLIAAKKMGMKKVPVIYQEFESEEQFYAYVVSDNAIGKDTWAQLDLSQINKDIIDLGPDLDLDMLGLKDFVVEPIEKFEPQADEDAVPDIKDDPVTKRGNIWLLGNHRLMCGDSTMIDDVEKLMNGEKADITFTSPPYNIGKSVRGNMYENNQDDKSSDDYTKFLIDWTNLAIMFSNYVFHNNQLLEGNKKSLINYQHHFVDQIKDILIWNKHQFPPHINKGTFGTKWEYVFCLSENGKGRGFPCQWQGKFSNVIETESNLGNKFAGIHRAGFPVSFPSWLIKKMDFTKSVYEPFMGTGTTMISCENLGIKSFGMELDPVYCDLIVERWENYTGKKAVLENGDI